VPAAAETDQDVAGESQLVQPHSAGTEGAHFTSSRLVPLKADQEYPYRTVGKLFFTQPEGDKVCSASVIKRRLILTAGHCVHRGSGGIAGFFTNFFFIPAFRDGKAPYDSWKGAVVWTTLDWMTSGGETFPNAADYALIELQDEQGQRIGDVVGFLGYQTGKLIPNHAHLLGYPTNLDGGMKMHQVTAGSFREVSPNAQEYGSDMGGGSSGGPWVQDFGQVADGQTGKRIANRVIGVTSYGRTNPKRKVQGSSILDERFINLLNEACASRPDNC
jgi:V8-like Glu-specific endopeptidase